MAVKNKVNRNTYDISSTKHVTRKFREVSHSSRAKKCTKKCAVCAKLFFSQLDLLIFFAVFVAVTI